MKTFKVEAFNAIKSNKGTKILSKNIKVKGKIGDIITDVQPQLTCKRTLEIATGQVFEISIYSTVDNLAINYTMYDGVNEYKYKSSLTGKATFTGLYKNDYAGNIVLNASANGEVVKTLIPVKATKCGPFAIFKPISYKQKSPMIMTKANTLQLKYRHEHVEKSGCVYGNLVYKWRIFNIKDGSLNEVPNFSPVGGYDKPIFHVAPRSLQEGNYTINMSLTYTTTKQCYTYETFIEVHRSDLFCAIRGGSKRGVAYESGVNIVLDGSRSVDPDDPNASKLSYLWKCRRSNDNTTNNVSETDFK